MTKQRIKLKNKCKIKFEDKILITITLIAIVTYAMIKNFSVGINKTMVNYAKNKSIEMATIIVNDAIKEISKSNNLNDLMIIQKNKSDEITNISFDNNKTNKILYEINENILKNINEVQNYNDSNSKNSKKENKKIYMMPINIAYKNVLLSAIGPKIPFKLEIVNSTSNNIKTTIKEYGINNSIVEIFVIIELNTQIILPFSSSISTIKKEIPISTKIIEGKIPKYYGGMISTKSVN